MSENVSLPFNPLEASDGTINPLTEKEEKELREHINSGHLTKRHLCKGCLLSEGPQRIHRRVRGVDRATHVLHIGIAGPFNASYDGFHYFLVGALRLPDIPLLNDVRMLRTSTSVEVCAALEKITAYFECLSFEGFKITDSTRIKRLHSDKAGEFTAPYFERSLSNHRSIYHTFTSGYDPQANGTAERSVGLVKTLPQLFRPTRGVLDLLCPVCCSESDLRSSSAQAALTSTRSICHSNGLRLQGD